MTTAMTVELWIVTDYTSEFGGLMEVEAGSPQEAVELPALREWAAAGDYGDARSVRVQFLVYGEDRAVVARSATEAIEVRS